MYMQTALVLNIKMLNLSHNKRKILNSEISFCWKRTLRASDHQWTYKLDLDKSRLFTLPPDLEHTLCSLLFPRWQCYQTDLRPVCLMHSKASLLITRLWWRKIHCLLAGIKLGELAASAQKPRLPDAFQESIVKGKVREGSPRVWDQLVHDFLIGWWWGNRVVDIINC